MDAKQISLAVNGTLGELLQLISTFCKNQFNVIPYKDSWTAGQLSQHLVMSMSGFVQMVNGPVKDAGRAPDQMVEKIKSDFLNFNTKMKSPDFIVPPVDNYDKEALTDSLKDIRHGINDAINNLDLTKACMSFELPVYGFLTRLEAISFVTYHTQRHVHQLKKIQKRVLQEL